METIKVTTTLKGMIKELAKKSNKKVEVYLEELIKREYKNI